MKEDKLIKYLKAGSEIAGSTVAGAISLIGGPAATLIGGGAGVVVTKGFLEVTERFVTNQQLRRLGAAAAYSLVKINQRIDKGHRVRKDVFFSRTTGRSNADELLEGVLLKSKDQYQERKIEYISNIYSNTIFDEDLSAENANAFLMIIDQLSYRKMCILAMFSDEERVKKYNLRTERITFKEDLEVSFELNMILQDMKDLFDLFLIVNTEHAVMYKECLTPNFIRTSSVGEKLVNLMELQQIPEKEYAEIIESLK